MWGNCVVRTNPCNCRRTDRDLVSCREPLSLSDNDLSLIGWSLSLLDKVIRGDAQRHPKHMQDDRQMTFGQVYPSLNSNTT